MPKVKVKIRLSKWLKLQGVSRTTAYRWMRDGKFPAEIERTPTGRIYVVVGDHDPMEESK